jgi:hypothetical protein
MRESQSAVAAKPFIGCWLCSQNFNIYVPPGLCKTRLYRWAGHARVFKASIAYPLTLAKEK